MTRVYSSRREFLQNGSAALAAGGALSLVNGRALAQQTAGAGAARQAVACTRREAAEAARDILQQGGNAIDAAAAALLVQCVIEPTKVGLGGYGASLVAYLAKTGRVHAIDATGPAPRGFDPDKFSEAVAFHGYQAVGVPGVVGGIDLALRKYGTLPFKSVAGHAAALAEKGVTVSAALAGAFAALDKTIDAATRRAHFPTGVPAAGATWVQADLARLIRRLGDEGPGSFYQGDVAARIAAQVQAGGGALAAEDLHAYQARVVEPLRINYRGYDLYTPPLPSGGLTSLIELKTLEQFDLSQYEPWGAPYVELFAGASNLAWGERFQYFGDPDFVDVPVEELLSETRARARADSLRRGAPTAPSKPADPAHTVNIVVVDMNQNVVSWTATHGGDFGAQVAIEGLGLMLGHGMSRYAFAGDDPNSPAGGKRPQHNMSPMLALRDGKPYAAWGLPGGRRIVSVTTQLAVSLLDFHATPEQAVDAPRIHTEGQEPIQVTTTLPTAVVQELRRRGHQVDVQPSLGSAANMAVVDPQRGVVDVAASRGSTGVIKF
jgi:gamma-glutamyltranspeptidase/glutathione hydrolase